MDILLAFCDVLYDPAVRYVILQPAPLMNVRVLFIQMRIKMEMRAATAV